MTIRLLQGDVLDRLADLPDESVHCCITSPPYFGLRDYGVAGQIGLEESPTDYVAALVAVFREVRRVLRSDGTLWLNLGDSYNAHPGQRKTTDKAGPKQVTNGGSNSAPSRNVGTCKPKDLLGIPWMVAFALRADGWWLRQDIIWSKPNPMPESVTDRCTKAHEYLFLLSKSERYYYDADAIREDSITGDPRRPYTSEGAWQMDGRPVEQRHGGKPRKIKVPSGWDTGDGAHGTIHRDGRTLVPEYRQVGKPRTAGNKSHKYVDAYEASETEEHRTKAGLMKVADVPWYSRNRRSVWTVATAPFPEAHFATFPPALVEPCILAGCPKGGTVLDPFGGSGTTGLVADRLGRDAVLIELNPEYAEMAERRLRADAPLFAEIAAE